MGPSSPEAQPDARERAAQAALFYREIVIPAGEPIETPDDIDPINILVTSPTTLEINGTPLRLRGHQLFTWNVLAALRHQEAGVARGDVYAFGFGTVPGYITPHETTWARSISSLVEKVNGAAGLTVIERTGKTNDVKYHLDPRVRLVDLRTAETTTPYAFAQFLSGNVLRLDPEERVEVDSNKPPIHLTIREDGSIVVNGKRPMFYNRGESALLNAFILNNGAPLTVAQFWGLGFHAYAQHDINKDQALYRTLISLNNLLGESEDDKVITTSKHAGGTTRIVLGRTLVFTDLRQGGPTPHRTAVQGQFETLLKTIPNDANEPITLSREHLTASLAGNTPLSILERFIVGLRFGIPQPELQGSTFMLRRRAAVLNYDDIAPHIAPGVELTRDVVGSLLGMARSTVYTHEQRALKKLLVIVDAMGAKRNIELRPGLPVTEALLAWQKSEPSQRLEHFLNGTVVYGLSRQLALRAAEAGALAFHLLPQHTNLRYRQHLTDLLRDLKTIAEEIKDEVVWLTNRHVSHELATRVLSSQEYLTKLLKGPQHSFDRTVLTDADFAQHGHQMVADALTFLEAYLSARQRLLAG